MHVWKSGSAWSEKGWQCIQNSVVKSLAATENGKHPINLLSSFAISVTLSISLLLGYLHNRMWGRMPCYIRMYVICPKHGREVKCHFHFQHFSLSDSNAHPPFLLKCAVLEVLTSPLPANFRGRRGKAPWCNLKPLHSVHLRDLLGKSCPWL